MPSDAPAPATHGSSAQLITAHMTVSDILALIPQAEHLLARYGLHCASCDARGGETLREGCASHGFSEEDIDDLTTDLQLLYANTPAREQRIDITEAAAAALHHILSAQQETNLALCVLRDETGRYCMECRPPEPDDATFAHPAFPTVRVCASAVTLAHIGGAVIDMRDGRFKLDLPQTPASCACKIGESCRCAPTT